MNKDEFNTRWNNASKNDREAFITYLCTLFFKKTLENGETRLEKTKRLRKELKDRRRKNGKI